MQHQTKRRTHYLNAAGRPSESWPDATGSSSVPFLGTRIAADGTVGLERKKTRAFLRELEQRTHATARTLTYVDRESIGRAICSVVNRSLDLKRLELRVFTNLRRRFERHTFELAWALGLVFAACAAAIATAFYGRGLGSLYAALLAFFLARSHLAHAQIQAFADGAYAALFATGVLCVAGLAAVGPLADSETQRMTGVAIVTAVSAVALSRIRGSARARGEPGAALLPLEWLARLGQIPSEVRVGSARVVSAGGPERLDTRTREDRNRWRLTQLSERAPAASERPERLPGSAPTASSGSSAPRTRPASRRAG